MSMTIYPITGATQTVTMTDTKRAAGTFTGNSGGVPSGASGGIIEILQDREVTKAGATRIMIKLTAKSPFTNQNGIGSIVAPISLHLVLTVPKVVAEQMLLETSGAAEPPQGLFVIAWLNAVMTALINTKSIASLPTVSADLPLIQAVVGTLPLNLASGTYGSAS